MEEVTSICNQQVTCSKPGSEGDPVCAKAGRLGKNLREASEAKVSCLHSQTPQKLGPHLSQHSPWLCWGNVRWLPLDKASECGTCKSASDRATTWTRELEEPQG